MGLQLTVFRFLKAEFLGLKFLHSKKLPISEHSLRSETAPLFQLKLCINFNIHENESTFWFTFKLTGYFLIWLKIPVIFLVGLKVPV